MSEELHAFLIEKAKSKESFSLAELKRTYKKDKNEIKKLKFIGLIDTVNVEYPDTVQSFIYN